MVMPARRCAPPAGSQRNAAGCPLSGVREDETTHILVVHVELVVVVARRGGRGALLRVVVRLQHLQARYPQLSPRVVVHRREHRLVDAPLGGRACKMSEARWGKRLVVQRTDSTLCKRLRATRCRRTRCPRQRDLRHFDLMSGSATSARRVSGTITSSGEPTHVLKQWPRRQLPRTPLTLLVPRSVRRRRRCAARRSPPRGWRHRTRMSQRRSRWRLQAHAQTHAPQTRERDGRSEDAAASNRRWWRGRSATSCATGSCSTAGTCSPPLSRTRIRCRLDGLGAQAAVDLNVEVRVPLAQLRDLQPPVQVVFMMSLVGALACETASLVSIMLAHLGHHVGHERLPAEAGLNCSRHGKQKAWQPPPVSQRQGRPSILQMQQAGAGNDADAGLHVDTWAMS